MNLAMILLRLRLALQRLGWGNLCTVLALVLATGIWLAWLPHVRQQRDATRIAISAVSAELRKPPALTSPVEASTPESNLDDFYDTLGEKRHVEQQVKTLFALAKKEGMALAQGEYKTAFDKQGRFYKYQVILPVKGSYGTIREFCEHALKSVPFASLDELNFKRDNITNRIVEAKLRFTFYLTDAAKTVEKE